MDAPPQSSDYRWDVFLSFRRWQGWPQWVQKLFTPTFTHWLGEELGEVPRIFVDWKDRQPGDWPSELGRELARSRVLVPLMSRLYFGSPWCSAEYELMRLRESRCGKPLITPAVIQDGKYLPEHARRAYSAQLQDFSSPWIVPNGPKHEALAEEIKRWVPTVVQAIEAAPPCDPSWEHDHVEAMDRAFEAADQSHVPSWGA